MAQRIIQKIQSVQSTTDAATTTTIGSFTVPSNGSYHIEARVTGRNTANGDTVSAVVAGRFKRVSGTLSIIGTILSISALGGDAGLTTCVVSIDTNSDDIRVRATGVIATTIEWFTDMQIWIN